MVRAADAEKKLSGDLTSGPEGRVLPLQLGSRFGFWRQRLSELKTLDIWDFLSQVRKGQEYRHLVILAWGGFGKTTLLRHITAVYAQGGRRRRTPKLVPFFIRLRQWGTVLAAKDAPRLAEFLRERHIAEGLELGPPPLAWVKHLLETGQALVLLDGFDEVPAEQREAVSLWIGRELEACSQAVFILSSRPGGYEDYVAERKPRTKLFVKPFTLDQIRDFARKWYVCQERLYRDKSAENREAVAAIAREKTQDLIGQIEKRKELRDLSSNPLLLNMLANYHRFYQGAELPKRRGDLYRDVFKMQLCDRPLAKGKEMDPPWPENQPILQGLALAMVQQNLTTISEAQLLEQLAPGLGEEAISPAGFLKQITEVSELLVERERQEYEFAHLSFQEYLAAAEIEKQGLEGELLKNYRESHWQGTLVLYAALTNPNRLLRGLLEKDTLEAAELAYKCLQETPRNVDEGLRGRCSKRSSRS